MCHSLPKGDRYRITDLLLDNCTDGALGATRTRNAFRPLRSERSDFIQFAHGGIINTIRSLPDVTPIGKAFPSLRDADVAEPVREFTARQDDLRPRPQRTCEQGSVYPEDAQVRRNQDSSPAPTDGFRNHTPRDAASRG